MTGRDSQPPAPNPPASRRTSLQSLIANLTSGDDQVAENAAESITALGEAALPALFDLLDAADLDACWWALRAIAEIPHPSVPPRLAGFLAHPDPGLRQCAALGFSKQPWPEAIPGLISILDDEDRLLARLAGDALVAAENQAVPSLIKAIENGSPAAKIEAARALALIEDLRAIPALFAAWGEGSSIVQHWCEVGFERMGVGMQFFKPD